MGQFGFNVSSPITHSHPMERFGLDGSWEWWKNIDTEYLHLSQRVIVLCIDGWRESVGVQAEIRIAKDLGLEIQYMFPVLGSLELQSTPPAGADL
jgi:hypothetical protein